jgi:sirohydrochlorin ferrochelatase
LTFLAGYDKKISLANSIRTIVKTAVIILGHGSRNSGSGDSLRQVASEVKRLGMFEVVEYAYLQYADPAPQSAFESCVRQNVERIVVVPFFMQPGAHVARDVPALAEKAKRKYPTVDIVVTDYAGSHPLMTKIIVDLVRTSSG